MYNLMRRAHIRNEKGFDLNGVCSWFDAFAKHSSATNIWISFG